MINKRLILAAPLLAASLSGCIVGGSAAPKATATPVRLAAVIPTSTPAPDPALNGVAARLIAVRTMLGRGVSSINNGLSAQSQGVPGTAQLDFRDSLAQFQLAAHTYANASVTPPYDTSGLDLQTAIQGYQNAASQYLHGSNRATGNANLAAKALARADRELGVRPEIRLTAVQSAAQALVSKIERTIVRKVTPRPVPVRHTAPAPAKAKPSKSITFAVVTSTILTTPTVAPTSTTVPTVTPAPKPTATPKPTVRPTLATPSRSKPATHPRPAQSPDNSVSVAAAQATALQAMQGLTNAVTVVHPVTDPAFVAAQSGSNHLQHAVTLLQWFQSTHDPRIQSQAVELRVLAASDLNSSVAGLAALSARSPAASGLVRAAELLYRGAAYSLWRATRSAQHGATGQFAQRVARAESRIEAGNKDLQSAEAMLTLL